MRLIMQTNGGNKFARSMIESSKMSLLMKNSSNDKLNDIADDCKDLPGVVLEKCQILANHWYQQTEEQRKRLRFQLQKNWFRLAISVLVVVAQFYWFSSYYLHFGETTTITKEFPAEVEFTQNFVGPIGLVQRSSSLPLHHHTVPRFDLVNQSFQEYTENDCYIWNREHYPRIQHPYPHNLPSFPHSSPHSKSSQHNRSSNNRSSSESDSTSVLSVLVNIFWKIFLTIKLICMMVFFELLRMSDTFWKVLFNCADDEEDESKNRTTKKSPVDVGYIERNRGYK